MRFLAPMLAVLFSASYAEETTETSFKPDGVTVEKESNAVAITRLDVYGDGAVLTAEAETYDGQVCRTREWARHTVAWTAPEPDPRKPAEPVALRVVKPEDVDLVSHAVA